MKKLHSIMNTIFMLAALFTFGACDNSNTPETVYTVDVVFRANGGTGTMEGTTLSKTGEASSFSLILPECTFKKEGYTFVGWIPSLNNTNCFEPGTNYTWTNTVTKTVEFYAKWKKNGYIALTSHTETEDSTKSNFNNEINPGETFSVSLRFCNTGELNLINGTAQVYCETSSKLEIIKGRNTDIGNISAGKYFNIVLDCTASSNITATTECKIDYKLTFKTEKGETVDFSGYINLPIIVKVPDIPSAYWGTWIRMDTGDTIYINDSGITNTSTNQKIQTGISGWTTENEYIIKNGSIAYFKKGGKNRDFSLTLSGLKSDALKNASNLQVIRTNTSNPFDTEAVTPDSTGKAAFKNAVAGDTQKITISADLPSDNKLVSSVDVTPRYNGEFIGTVPVVEKGSFGFKTTYAITNDNDGFCYGNFYEEYSLTLNINNIGNTTSSFNTDYKIISSDSNLSITGNTTGAFYYVNPGEAKTVNLKLKYGKLEEEYIDVPLKINIKDLNGNEWNDTINLRFYKGTTSLVVAARKITQSGTEKLNGFMLHSNGLTKHFSVTGDQTVNNISLPWSKNDYILAFAGASKSSEIAYSFSINNISPVSLSGDWTSQEKDAGEPNNLPESATKFYDTTTYHTATPAKAYLQNGDIDFYITNNSFVTTLAAPLSTGVYGLEEVDSSTGNGDNQATPGESLYMDIKVQNLTNADMNNITATLSTKNSNVSITNNSHKWNSIKKNSIVSTTSSDGTLFSSSSSWYSNAFKFTVSETCPDKEVIPFTITLSDGTNKWTNEISVTVYKTLAKIKLMNPSATPEKTNFTVKEDNGNGDNLPNPGETVFLDAYFSNIGQSKTFNTKVTLSTESPYISLIKSSCDRGTIVPEKWYSLTSSGNLTDKTYYLMRDTSSAFKFSISDDCPYNTEIPFKFTFTDSKNNTWTDSLSVTVKAPDVKLSVAAFAFSDEKGTDYSNNNDEGSINPNEKIRMDIRLFNSGTAKALTVKVLLSSTSPYITFNDNIESFNTISSKYYVTKYTSSQKESNAYFSLYSNFGYIFTVAENTPYNTEIPIQVKITDKYSNTWTDTIKLTVVEPKKDIDIDLMAFSDEIYNGTMNNSNGKINAGERIFLNASLKNTGVSRLDNVKTVISSTSTDITLNKTDYTLGTIKRGYYCAAGNSETSTQIVQGELIADSSNNIGSFTIKADTAIGTTIPIIIKIYDGSTLLRTKQTVFTVE